MESFVDDLTTDQTRTFAGSLLMILAVTWATFRSLRYGVLALLPCLLPLVLNLGVMGITGVALRPLTVITFCIAFGLAVDDTIHLLARYTEERRVLPVGEAVAAAMRTAGRPVIVTTLLLLTGFGTILSSSFKGTFQFGLFTSLALLGSLLGALLLLPALLLRGARDRQ